VQKKDETGTQGRSKDAVNIVLCKGNYPHFHNFGGLFFFINYTCQQGLVEINKSENQKKKQARPLCLIGGKLQL
jgi:hypothetical protein